MVPTLAIASVASTLAPKLLGLILVLAMGFIFTTRVIPWTFAGAIGLLGFSTKPSPITQKRIARFKRIRRGYWSFLIIVTLSVTSLFLELIVNSKPLVIHYDSRTAFPAVNDWLDLALPFVKISTFTPKDEFGNIGRKEVDYQAFARYAADPTLLTTEVEKQRVETDTARAEFVRKYPKPGPDAKAFKVRRYERMAKRMEKRQASFDSLEAAAKVFAAGDAWILMPLYPYSPSDLRHDLVRNPPNKPTLGRHYQVTRNGEPIDRNPRVLPAPDGGFVTEDGQSVAAADIVTETVMLGTDVSGRDVLALLVYGFRISMAFALVVAFLGYSVGIVVGAMQGYYGGWIDIITQRIQEIWGSIPFLFTIMIIASMVQPQFWVLVVLMVVLRSWLGITFYIRGEFYREKAKDYVQAAIGCGVSDWKVMITHILPNALVPVVTFAPFGIVAYIGSLVSLDYLGFGLPPGTPSWGALLRQGLENVKFYPHLVIVPVAALSLTLYCVVMIGEAVREAFDPKVFSRLR